MALFLCFFKFYFFAEFLGFETNVISTHHGVTFHAMVVSSWGHDVELNFNLAHCVKKATSFFKPRLSKSNLSGFGFKPLHTSVYQSLNMTL